MSERTGGSPSSRNSIMHSILHKFKKIIRYSSVNTIQKSGDRRDTNRVFTTGFALVELLIYVGIFAVSAVFLVSILTVVTQVQVRQTSVHEVNQQLSFVKDTVQRLVQTSSLVDMDAGVATSTLTLRMASSSIDQTFVYASSSTIYLKQISSSGTTTITPLTDSNVQADNFSVTKYESPDGFALVQIDLTLSYNTSNTRAVATRSLKTAVSRISAAQFDSNVYPNASNSFDLGTATNNWRNGYFSGDVGIGISSFGAAYKFVASGGDIATYDAGKGIVEKTPDGTACYRIGLTNSGTVTSTAVTCP